LLVHFWPLQSGKNQRPMPPALKLNEKGLKTVVLTPITLVYDKFLIKDLANTFKLKDKNI
jgi:hypothetical protein